MSRDLMGLGVFNMLYPLCRNVLLGIGMCPDKKWETISNGSWARSMSPFGHKLLDLRVVGSSLDSFEVSIEKGSFSHLCVHLFVPLGLNLRL